MIVRLLAAPVVLALALCMMTGSDARAQVSSVPATACARDALAQLIIWDGLQSQRVLTDRLGRAWGSEVVFRGKLLGRRDSYVCTYTNATRKTVIEPYRPAAKPPATGAASQRTAEAACTRAAQARNLSVAKVVKSTPSWAGRELVLWIVEMTVVDKKGTKTASCRYDTRTARTVLDVQKPATR